MAKNKALLLLNILLITATTSRLTLASGGASSGPHKLTGAADNGKTDKEAQLADTLRASNGGLSNGGGNLPHNGIPPVLKDSGVPNPLEPIPAARAMSLYGNSAGSGGAKEADMQSASYSESQYRALQARIKALEEALKQKEHPADTHKETITEALEAARKKFATRDSVKDNDEAKRAAEHFGVEMDRIIFESELPTEYYIRLGAQQAAREQGYEQAMPLAEKLRKIREKAELSRAAAKEAGAIDPVDLKFEEEQSNNRKALLPSLKDQIAFKAELDAHYQVALEKATPFHRELRSAIKEGFIGGIANGVGQATGTYLVRAIDWFWNGVYYNISSNRKRRDAQIEAAMHEENVLNQRSFLNGNSKMLNNFAQTAEVTKRVLKDDIAGLEAANIGVKKLLTLTSRAEKEVEARAKFEDAIEDCKKEQMKLSGEIKVLSESKDNKKLSEALKREKELGQEIASLEAMKKAAQLKVDAQLAPLVEELNEEDFASHIQFVQNQMKILIAQKDELISIKTEIASKSKSLSPADMKKANDDLAEINKSLKEGEETFKMFKQQLTLCAELSMPGASRNLLNEPMNISLLEMLLMQINLAKRVEIKALKDQSLTISKDLVSRLTSHNKKFATLDKRDESDLAASIEYFEGLSNKSSPEKSAA